LFSWQGLSCFVAKGGDLYRLAGHTTAKLARKSAAKDIARRTGVRSSGLLA
jgi:hypothetical protein